MASATTLWLAFAAGDPGSVERALADLLRLAGLSEVLVLLGVDESALRAWAKPLGVPPAHHGAIRADLARRLKAEGQAQRGQWEQYRQAHAQGFGSYAEIAARFNVTKQAVGKAIAYERQQAARTASEEPQEGPPPKGRGGQKRRT